MATVSNEWLSALLRRFLEDDAFMARFALAAAGKKWHHAYRGGLARHCLEVAQIAERVCEVFPNIDRDLVLTAVFLHDIGKLSELTQDLFVEYSTEGKLLGHLHIGADMVQQRIDEIEGFPQGLRLQLFHCLLSHHGELANGSPVVPKTLEATVLYHCDNLDAQADALTRVVRETKEKGQIWSDYLPLIDRQVWTKDGYGEV